MTPESTPLERLLVNKSCRIFVAQGFLLKCNGPFHSAAALRVRSLPMVGMHYSAIKNPFLIAQGLGFRV